MSLPFLMSRHFWANASVKTRWRVFLGASVSVEEPTTTLMLPSSWKIHRLSELWMGFARVLQEGTVEEEWMRMTTHANPFQSDHGEVKTALWDCLNLLRVTLVSVQQQHTKLYALSLSCLIFFVFVGICISCFLTPLVFCIVLHCSALYFSTHALAYENPLILIHWLANISRRTSVQASDQSELIIHQINWTSSSCVTDLMQSSGMHCWPQDWVKLFPWLGTAHMQCCLL